MRMLRGCYSRPARASVPRWPIGKGRTPSRPWSTKRCDVGYRRRHPGRAGDRSVWRVRRVDRRAVNPYSRVWRAADAVMALLFTFAALLQVNDPDPVRWFTIYALAGLACELSVLRRLRWAFPALLCVAAVAWASTIAPRVVGRVPFRDMF